MKSIQHSATLFYYDGPQVIEARDRIGGHYVGVAIDAPPSEFRFAFVGCPPERLRELRSGVCDLRSVFMENWEAGWWVSKGTSTLKGTIEIEPGNGDPDRLGFFPDEGFFLQSVEADEGLDMVFREAGARNNLVWEITLEPPESAEGHRIRLTTYSSILLLLQSLARHAYAKAIADLPKATRKGLDTADAFLFDVVVPAAPGSFKFLLESARPPDLLGHAEITRGMERLDTLFSNPGDPTETLEILQRNRGHLAAAYIRLMDFLVRNRTGIRYAWADPARPEPVVCSVSEGQAKPLYESLSRAEKLAEETVTVVGRLRKVDLDNRTWRLGGFSDEGERQGKVKEDGPSLSHLVTDQWYRFTCEEVIEEITGTGRELRTLFLAKEEEITEIEFLKEVAGDEV